MKLSKPLLLLVFLLLIMSMADAQNVIVKTYLEKTQMSPKTGTSISYENSYGWEVGGFFQESSLMESLMMSEAEKEAMPRFYEKEFYGAFFSAPLKKSEKMDMKLNVRTGVTNGQNFTITPSLLVDYKPLKSLKVGVGAGVRVFKPTLQWSVSFVL